jgi:hypothetical protein
MWAPATVPQIVQMVALAQVLARAHSAWPDQVAGYFR